MLNAGSVAKFFCYFGITINAYQIIFAFSHRTKNVLGIREFNFEQY